MKRKERYMVRLDEVKFTRESDYVDIDYKEPGVPSTRLVIGPQISVSVRGTGNRQELGNLIDYAA
jgi:hypothetical protein